MGGVGGGGGGRAGGGDEADAGLGDGAVRAEQLGADRPDHPLADPPAAASTAGRG